MALVLIAEDAWMTRRMVSKALQTNGHETLEASNGCECLEMVSTLAPDCIILDLLMPEMDGLEVLAALSQQHPRIPVIVMTADIQETSRQRCLNLGATAVINKPLDSELLLHELQKALGW